MCVQIIQSDFCDYTVFCDYIVEMTDIIDIKGGTSLTELLTKVDITRAAIL